GLPSRGPPSLFSVGSPAPQARGPPVGPPTEMLWPSTLIRSTTALRGVFAGGAVTFGAFALIAVVGVAVVGELVVQVAVVAALEEADVGVVVRVVGLRLDGLRVPDLRLDGLPLVLARVYEFLVLVPEVAARSPHH